MSEQTQDLIFYRTASRSSRSALPSPKARARCTRWPSPGSTFPARPVSHSTASTPGRGPRKRPTSFASTSCSSATRPGTDSATACSTAARTGSLPSGGPASPRGGSWTSPCPRPETSKRWISMLKWSSFCCVQLWPIRGKLEISKVWSNLPFFSKCQKIWKSLKVLIKKKIFFENCVFEKKLAFGRNVWQSRFFARKPKSSFTAAPLKAIWCVFTFCCRCNKLFYFNFFCIFITW